MFHIPLRRVWLVKEIGLAFGTARNAVQRRRKIVLVPPALRARPARLNSKNSSNASTVSAIKNRGGALRGNRNALKHGKYTREHLALYADVRAHIREGNALIALAKAIDVTLGKPRITITEHIRIENGDVVSRRTVRKVRYLVPGYAALRDDLLQPRADDRFRFRDDR